MLTAFDDYLIHQTPEPVASPSPADRTSTAPPPRRPFASSPRLNPRPPPRSRKGDAMLTAFHDYLIHQTPGPVASPSTGDRNFYDRHFFNGFTRAGDLFFGAALGLYPNRRVMDAAFTLVRDGRQLSVHASRLAPAERGETRVGPIAIEVVEALRTLRVPVAANDFGLEADLLFRARGPALEEPRFTARVENRLFMDTTRLTQFGLWEGTITAGNARLALAPLRALGVRDRSWGVRPVGEPEGGAHGLPPQFF